MLRNHETILKLRAAWTAKDGTREEYSDRFLPPPGRNGHLVTATKPRTSANAPDLLFRHPSASRAFAAQTGDPAARESATLSRAPTADILPEPIAFGAAGSPGSAARPGG